MKILYLAKEPDQGVKSDLTELSKLSEVTVGACNPGYIDFYKKIGYNVISKNVFFDGSDMKKFDVLIGNPPYDNQMYRKFLSKIPDLIDKNGRFDLLFPVYTFTRKKCIDILKSGVKIDTIDMRPGHHFKHTVNGAWVIRISGTLGVTDKFDITLPNGDVIKDRTLDDINPSSAVFVEDMVKTELAPLCMEDYTIANKVLNSSASLIKHKDNISSQYFTYLSPIIRRMTAKDNDEYPGTLHLRTMVKQSDKTNDGYYVDVKSQDEAVNLSRIYGRSKLFVYLFWATASDSIYSDSFIKRLPNVDGLVYNSDEDIYKYFDLTDKEIARIEEVMNG